jgi:putative redox protein
MSARLDVVVDLTNDKVHFTGVSALQPDRPVEFDYGPPIGDGQGHTGLELFLLSLAGCSGTTLVYLLRQQGRTVTGLRVEGHGVRRTQHPMAFEKINLDFTVTTPDASDEDIRTAIDLAERSVCPVWSMIADHVEVRTGFTRKDASR